MAEDKVCSISVFFFTFFFLGNYYIIPGKKSDIRVLALSYVFVFLMLGFRRCEVVLRSSDAFFF